MSSRYHYITIYATTLPSVSSILVAPLCKAQALGKVEVLLEGEKKHQCLVVYVWQLKLLGKEI